MATQNTILIQDPAEAAALLLEHLRPLLKPPQPVKALTVSEAAVLLDVSESTVRKMHRDGRLPAGNVGKEQKDLRFHPETISRFLRGE